MDTLSVGVEVSVMEPEGLGVGGGVTVLESVVLRVPVEVFDRVVEALSVRVRVSLFDKVCVGGGVMVLVAVCSVVGDSDDDRESVKESDEDRVLLVDRLDETLVESL